MKSFICGFVSCAAIGLTGAAALNLTTQAQATVSPVLETLKFKSIPDPQGRIGGDQEYEATKATHDAVKPGKRFVLKPDGSLSAK